MKKAENRKFHGLKRAVSEIKGCIPNSGMYIEVFYDAAEDKIITHCLNSFGYNSWVEYDDPDIIRVGDYSALSADTTMKELKQNIINAMKNV